jgi:DNA polymerase
VCDLSAIESRVLGWASGCDAINQIFAEGRDTYTAFAAEYYRVPESEVTPAQRKFSKPPVLGCGYQLGKDGLVIYAEGYSVDLVVGEAQRLVDLYREIYPEVLSMWYWLTDAFKDVIQNRTNTHTGCMVRIHGDEKYIYITLPSGRDICYYMPAMVMRVPPWGGDPRPTISYMGMDQYTHKWARITTHGGKITENIVQATARDILAVQMQVAVKNDLPVVAHVHDEIILEGDYLEYMQELMSWTPQWAQGLLLDASGFTTRRYRKE